MLKFTVNCILIIQHFQIGLFVISITQNIYIKADINKIWAYLTDFSQSLYFNRFHSNLELPPNYSLGKKDTFNINHNFGFGNYKMIAEVNECVPPKKLSISEYCPDDPNKGFPHKIIFTIDPDFNRSKLNYTVSGTYGGVVQDMSFKPILQGVIKEELLKIKNAIESSEVVHKIIDPKMIKPI